jgi:hypothetical protein
MVVFGIEAEKQEDLEPIIAKIKLRLEDNDIISNPLRGKIITRKGFYIFNLSPIYPPYYLWGLPLLVGAFALGGFRLSYWMLPGIIIFSLGFFWSKLFLVSMLRLSIRRQGYGVRLKVLSNKKLVERLIDGTI